MKGRVYEKSLKLMDQDNIDNLCYPTATRRSHNLGLVTAVYKMLSVETVMSDPKDEKDHKCDKNKIKRGPGDGVRPEREES